MTDLQKIILKSYENLPNEKKAKPWSFVNHGVELLKNEDELNCYLAAYGKMHEEKTHFALSTLTNLKEIVKNKYQIVDWGCGQGLATLCFLDFIKGYLNKKKPQNITLIEPSKPAITKAKKYIEDNSKVINSLLIEKKLNDVDLSDIKITEPVTINFFSNILDIESIDLKKLAKLIKSNLKGEQYFLCIGPMNATSTRIDTFAKLLNCTEEQLIGKENGKLKTTRGTIKLLVFKIKGTEIEIIKSIYYPPMPKNNNIMHILEKKLREIDVNRLSSLDKIIEYYKIVVELEQLKEPAVDSYSAYNYELKENNYFVVDLESNKSFLEIFDKNRDSVNTKWPKDLNISLEIGIEEKKYSILNYTYLFKDIKEINTKTGKIKLQLSNFELNYSTLISKFEKDEEGIDEIENLIKEQKTLEGVLNVLRENLNETITFDNKLRFALSSNDSYSAYNYELKENNYFVVDLESNKSFLEIFDKNRDSVNTRWPKDLNISLEIGIEEKKYSILNYTYLFKDIKEINTKTEKIKLQLSNFELNYSTLTSKFEKDEEGIDEIENLIKEQKTLEGVLNVLRENLNETITFDNKLRFALSSKNPVLSQIYSELRKVNRQTVKHGSLLSDFLFNKPIENTINKYSNDDLIQISNLDDSQKDAILSALNNKVSVITGPPGSGKTQVISNILANAVLQNKKVLVASKNNQAVDNVKTRFDREENTGFFLRFGNKKILGQTTLPEITRISALKSTLLDNAKQLKESQEKTHEIIKIKSDNKRKLEQRDLFQSKLPDLKKNIENLENTLIQISQNNTDFERIRLNHKIDSIETYISSAKKQRNLFELKYSGLNKIWINWFTKKKYAFEFITFIDEKPKDFKVVFKSIPNKISEFKSGVKILETYDEIIESLNLITNYYTKYSKINDEFESESKKLKTFEDYISRINSKEIEINKIIESCNVQIIEQNKVVLKEKIENKLFNASQAKINNYKDYLPDNIPWRNEDVISFTNATKNFLEVFNIVSVTSLSAKASLPLANELFDMVVIDEASQCDIASAIPLILRAKQLVVIGDPLQLKHITSLNKFEEEKIKEHLHLSGSVYLKYKEKSLWDYSQSFITNANNNNKVTNINRHYRCHPDIIGCSNEAFYIPKLGVDLKICTKNEDFKIQPNGIRWIDVKGTHKAPHININEAEVNKSIQIARYFANQNRNISIGIVTPFSHQAKEIHRNIPPKFKEENNPRIVTDTVHKFQGDEKDVMIYSLVVTNNSPDSKLYWIDNMVPESVNVAVTRARNTIIIVGNKEYIKSKFTVSKPLGKLVDYVENL